jgi:hypothetical protein
MGFFGTQRGTRARRDLSRGRLQRSVAAVVDALEPRRLFYAPIPAGYSLVGTLDVSVASGATTTFPVLQNGKVYRLIASGSVSNNSMQYDAEYRWTGNSPENVVSSVDVGIALGSGVGINWGLAQSDYKYSATVTGAGSALVLQYLGGGSGWSGSISVSLFAPLEQIRVCQRFRERVAGWWLVLPVHQRMKKCPIR